MEEIEIKFQRYFYEASTQLQKSNHIVNVLPSLLLPKDKNVKLSSFLPPTIPRQQTSSTNSSTKLVVPTSVLIPSHHETVSRSQKQEVGGLLDKSVQTQLFRQHTRPGQL